MKWTAPLTLGNHTSPSGPIHPAGWTPPLICVDSKPSPVPYEKTAIELDLPSAAEFRSTKEAEEIPNGPLIQSLPASSPIRWKIELLGSPSWVVILETFPFRTRTKPPPRVAIQSVSWRCGKMDQIRSRLSSAKAGSCANLPSWKRLSPRSV